MKRGFPRHLNTMFLPSGISPSLTSILAMAKTSLDADKLMIKELTKLVAEQAPTTPTAPDMAQEKFFLAAAEPSLERVLSLVPDRRQQEKSGTYLSLWFTNDPIALAWIIGEALINWAPVLTTDDILDGLFSRFCEFQIFSLKNKMTDFNV